MTDLRCVMDYETFSEVAPGDRGAGYYAQHPSTSIFCLAYKINDGPIYLWIPERAPMPDDLWECFQYGILVAQNAGFEKAITQYTLPRYALITDAQRKVIENIPISRWRCTAAKAAMCSLPRSLEMAASALGLKTQKDLYGHKLIKKYCKPRKPSKKNPKTRWDNKKDLRDIYKYCIIDVQAEYELDQALPDLSDAEQAVWELDHKINERGILIDIPTVKLILSMISEEIKNITLGIHKLSHGTIEKATQNGKMLKWINEHGGQMQNLQAQTIRDKLEGEDISRVVRQMLEYRQGGSKTSTAKYLKMVQSVGPDNRARELLLYAGAIPTHRWSGKRIQPHNFPRPTIKDFNSNEAIELIQSGGIEAVRKRYGKDKVMDVLVCTIRGMLIASPGCELFCADFAAVEARLAFWVAGHHEGVKAFRDGRKLYEEMAAAAFGMSLEWLCTKAGKESLERFVGKESVLGCQYGMGWKKFMTQCHKKGVKQVTPEIAKKAVYTYRKIHYPIPQAWKTLEQAIIEAIQNPGSVHKCLKVSIYVKNKFLHIKLPSGRRMRYYRPRLSQKQLAGGRMVPQIHYWTVDNYEWAEIVNWGGGFFNHIVQGIARDLMMLGTMNIEDAGYKFLLSVHDEGLAERKKGEGDLKEFIHLMSGQLPDWAKGAPITAEGWTGLRYKK